MGSIQIELVLGVGLFDLRETCNEQDVPDAHQLKVALELSVIRLPTCRLICNGLGHRGTLLGTKFVVSVSRWR